MCLIYQNKEQINQKKERKNKWERLCQILECPSAIGEYRSISCVFIENVIFTFFRN